MTTTSTPLNNIITRAAALSLLLLAGACGAGESAAPAAASAPGAQREVQDFIARREQCDHFRGEEGTTPKRQAQIDAKLKEFCTGTDAQLQALKRKYKADKAVMKSLAGFEEHIE